eukprot:TRINITY_DN12094_c0_g1_i1.p1 TRINITY_DN12094_c0_g1~~TRINITY_DN12094_c0_g1_i1.p1  ORF type:complete len:268 (-),score=45.67 TRINITY_DN12094_c0_g1_i1:15-818(-)
MTNNLVLHQPDNWSSFLDFLQSNPFDLGVVVSFGHLIPSSIIKTFKLGLINMHPSLLPRHRGAAPIYHTLLNDDKTTGVSIIEILPKKFDAGKILTQIKYDIPDDITYNDLSENLAELGSHSILQTIGSYHLLKSNAQAQSDKDVTYAPKVNREMGRIWWDKYDAKEVWIKYRAFGNTLGVYCDFEGKEIKLIKLEKWKDNIDFENQIMNDKNPGYIYFEKTSGLVWIKCRKGWVACSSVQKEGKKVTDSKSFVNGFLGDRTSKSFK